MPSATTFLLIVSCLLGGFGLLIIVGNLGIYLVSLISKKYQSGIPLVGGVSLSIGMFLCPNQFIHSHAWIGLVLDLGTCFFIPLFCCAVTSLVLKCRMLLQKARKKVPLD